MSLATATGTASAAAEMACALVDTGVSAQLLLPQDPLGLAWALKDLCYAAWSSEPQRAARAADALRALCGTTRARTDANLPTSQQAREIEALADWTGGIGHITHGEMGEAVASLDRASQGFATLGQADHAAQTQVPKIMALSMLGRYDDAADCAEQALRAFVAMGDTRAAGKVSLNLGALQERRGAYRQAARHAREAAVLFARVGDHEHSVMADINMADALTSLGDFDEALRIFARARMRAATHRFPVLAALVDESVALLQLARGQYPDALAGLEASRRQYEQLDMPQHQAIAEKQLAVAYLELRLLPEALALFDAVLARFEALAIPDEQAWTLAQRGRTLALLQRPGPAAQSFERAAGLFAAQGNGVGAAAVALARAELALAAGAADTAAALATQAANGFSTTGLADGRLRAHTVQAQALLQAGSVDAARALFDATLQQARDLQLLAVQVRCLTGQGLAAQDTPSARRAFQAAVELFEDQRRALPGDELRSAFLTDHLRPYTELLRIALQAHVDAATAERAVEVLRQLDRLRARSLGERVAHPAQAPEDDAATQALRERMNWLARRVQRLDDEGEPSAALSDELRRTERALLENARRARLAAPLSPHDAHSADDVDTAALQGALGHDGALVEYGVLDDEVFACVVSRAGVSLHRGLASWREVLEALRAARFQIDTLRHGAAPMRRHMDMLNQRAQSRMVQLHRLLWAPLAGVLSGCTQVLVVPHAQLGLLPFAALHDGTVFLAQRCQLAMVPSARLALRGLLRPSAVPRRALALGESSRLLHAAQEAQLVAGLFPHGRACVGEQATLAALRAHGGEADVIHLACHAQFRSDNPMFSALQLHDGPLTVEATETLGLRAGLVVLSACETGVTELGSGDEMVGLVRAFLVAGAARVLASQWPVDDAVTAGFMAAFHTALCRGAAPAAALQLAQQALMQDHPHPFFWAAFSLHGGW